MDINDIKGLIARDESRVLELKKTTGELVKGMQTLCAFLNSDGGWLFFGAPDKPCGKSVRMLTQNCR